MSRRLDRREIPTAVRSDDNSDHTDRRRKRIQVDRDALIIAVCGSVIGVARVLQRAAACFKLVEEASVLHDA